jgi:hypothetical protein
MAGVISRQRRDVPIEEAQQIQQREERNQPDVHLSQQPLRGFRVERDMILIGLRMLKLHNFGLLQSIAALRVRHVGGADIVCHVRDDVGRCVMEWKAKDLCVCW